MLFVSEEFTDQTVHLDDNSYVNCLFTRCRLVFSGGKVPTKLTGNTFDACTFDLEGPAARTRHYLETLAKDPAMREVVEKLFDDIMRGGTHGPDAS